MIALWRRSHKGDLLGKSRELRALHFRMDRDWLQS
jgi:hypothetical protein